MNLLSFRHDSEEGVSCQAIWEGTITICYRLEIILSILCKKLTEVPLDPLV